MLQLNMGGSGLPAFVTMLFGEMTHAANQSFAMYPFLSSAAYPRLIASGARMDENNKSCGAWYPGEWTGTMCLTEFPCRNRSSG